MTFSRQFATYCLYLALAPAIIATAATAVSASDTVEKKWITKTPRQSWASTDGVLNLQPGKAIPAASVADRLMIADAFARWGIAYDEGQLDVVRSLFTDKGKLEVLEGSAKPTQALEGPDAIVDAVKKDRAHQGDQRRHAISNTVIEKLDGDSATAIAYGVVTVAGNDDLYLGATVIYRGDLRKQPGGEWRFERFVIGMDAYKRSVPVSPTASK